MKRLHVGLLVVALGGAGCQFLAPRGSCTDGRINGNETDIDCGGPDCGPCGVSSLCLSDDDCETTSCAGSRCAAASCIDGLFNGDETDTDCGGSCAHCADGNDCVMNDDCLSRACVGNVCTAMSCQAPSLACGASCVNPMTDNANCGGCNNACTGGRTCSGGQCGCPGGGRFCGGACVDPMTSAQHCGGCGQACLNQDVCVGGMCRSSCPQGQKRCGGSCVDIMMSQTNCGDCNQPCGGPNLCLGGQCLPPMCPMGQQFCGQACVTLAVDPQHCGNCATSCAMNEQCIGGQCMAQCGGPLTNCSADGGVACTDTAIDPQNCNACGNVCPPTPHAVRECQLGTCGMGACFPAYDDCNNMDSDGCEAFLPADPMNCSVCGHQCVGPEMCVQGQCCGPLPPGPYLQQGCTNCTACDGTLRCDCPDGMSMVHTVTVPLGMCGAGFENCNGNLLCTGC